LWLRQTFGAEFIDRQLKPEDRPPPLKDAAARALAELKKLQAS
jgi:hypothetical protein